MTEKIKTVLLVGGGTGGHIVPILNIRQALLKTKAKIKVITVGGNSKTDYKFYQGLENHIVLVTGKLHRNITFENIIQLFCFGLKFFHHSIHVHSSFAVYSLIDLFWKISLNSFINPLEIKIGPKYFPAKFFRHVTDD